MVAITLRSEHSFKSGRFATYAILAVLTFLAFLSRYHFSRIGYAHPDEPIALGLAKGMLERGTLDTNWDHFDVTSMFRYPQFNFSSFHVFLAFVFKLLLIDPTVAHIRTVAALLGALCVPVTFELGRRMHSVSAGVFAAAMVAISPQLLFNSIFGRPETFFTLVYLCALLPVASDARSLKKLAASGFVFGLLAACKISALLLMPIPFLLFVSGGSQGVVRAAVTFAGALVAGFVCGAPYAIVDPHSFAYGVSMLSQQYSTGGGPSGLRDAPFFDRLGYLLKYLGLTVGPLVLMGCVASWRRSALGIISAVSALSIIYLGTRATFFERNFDHCLPVLFIAGWAGMVRLLDARATRWVLPVVAAIAMAPAIYYSYQLQEDILSGHYQDRVDAYLKEQALRGDPTVIVWPSIVYGDDPVGIADAYMKDKKLPATISFAWADDRFEEENIERFLSSYRIEKTGEMRDPFQSLPSNTVQAYIAPSYVTFRLLARK